MLTFAASGGGLVAVALCGIVVLGVAAQWIAWRLKVPSILILLSFGFIAGPGVRAFAPDSDWSLQPDALFGDVLLPLVGMMVGLILYEGGLTLRFREIKGTKATITMLVSVGAVITWALAGFAAAIVLGMSPQIATLFGAILIVTGPTVIGPMLSHIRPMGPVGPILKWEGIVIDPIGVGVTVLVFEVILATTTGAEDAGFGMVTIAVIKTILAGGGIGLLAAGLLILLMSRYWVPDALQNSFSLMLAVTAFTASNLIQTESGLLATTVMGIVLANQSRVDVQHILEFKENLRVLFISSLFVVLAARIQLDDLLSLNWLQVVLFLVVMIVVVRPVSVWISTIRSGMDWRQRVMLAWVAPRGIVAAASASIFSIALVTAGLEEASIIVPMTFMTIVGTVLFYGLTAPIAANWLGVADQDPQGVLFIGAPPWVRPFAKIITDFGFRVLLVDSNRSNVLAARMDGLRAEPGNVLSDQVIERLDLRGLGQVLAVTPNDEVNTLALQRFRELFDYASLYRLPTKQGVRAKSDEQVARQVGRRLFEELATHNLIESKVALGWIFKATVLSDEFDYADYRTLYGPRAILLCVLSGGKLRMAALDQDVQPMPGDTVVSLVNPEELLMPSFDKDDADDSETEREQRTLK